MAARPSYTDPSPPTQSASYVMTVAAALASPLLHAFPWASSTAWIAAFSAELPSRSRGPEHAPKAAHNKAVTQKLPRILPPKWSAANVFLLFLVVYTRA